MITFYLYALIIGGMLVTFYRHTYVCYLGVDSYKNWFTNTLADCWLPALAIVLVQACVFDRMVVPSGSMLPNIQLGQHILVNKTSFDYDFLFGKVTHAEPKRGEMVVTKFPYNTNISYVKVVIGTEGDTVAVKSTGILINDRLYPFVKSGTTTVDNRTIDESVRFEKMDTYEVDFGEFTVTFVQPEGTPIKPVEATVVPPGGLFLMGTNLAHSGDSRSFGPVSRDDLIGRML
jgi:signal peptidase I